MGFFGKGGFKEIGKLGLNSLAMPAEMLLGQNLYDPELEGKFTNKVEEAQEGLGQAGSAIVPMAASMIGGPGAGMAVSAARGLAPTINSGAEQWDPSSGMGKAAGMLGTAATVASLGSGFIGGGAGQAASMGADSMGGAASGAFSAGTEASMANTFQQGLTGTTGTAGFGQKLNQMNQFGTPMFPFGGQMPNNNPMVNGDLATFNGPSHEQGGINYQGIGEIEKQETVDMSDNYVFSDKLKRAGTKKTFAEVSKKFKPSDKDDDITSRTKRKMLDKLKEENEEARMQRAQKDFDKFMKRNGGFLYPNGGFINGLSQAQIDSTPGTINTDFQWGAGPDMLGGAGATAAWDGQLVNTAAGSGIPRAVSEEFHDRNQLIEGTQRRIAGKTGIDLNNIPQSTALNQQNLVDQGVWTQQQRNDYLSALDAQNLYYEKKGQQPMNYSGTNEFGQGAGTELLDQAIGPQHLGRRRVNPIAQTRVVPPGTFRQGGYIPTRTFGSDDSYGAGPVTYGSAPMYANGGTIEDQFNTQVATDFAPGGIFGSNVPVSYDPQRTQFEGTYTQAPMNAPSNVREDIYTQGPMGQAPGIGGNKGNKFSPYDAMMMLPAMWSGMQAAQGTEDTQPFYNPEYKNSMNLMSGRRYNINPELAQFGAARNAMKQGIGAVGKGNSGAELANLSGAQARYNQAVGQTMSRKQNMDNQYKGQEAQFRGQMGQQKSRAEYEAEMLNQRAAAQKDAYLQQMFNQFGHMGNVGQTNDIYRQLIDAGYGDLLNGELGKIART